MSKSDKVEAKKVVLISGGRIPTCDKVKKKFGQFEEIMYVGDGIKNLSELDLNNLKENTDENTLFIVVAHGDKHPANNLHYVDNIQTRSFLQKLQTNIGRKIMVDLTSCFGGGLLKRNEINNDNISVLTTAGSKYPTPMVEGNESIIEAITQKLNGKNNKEVFSHIISSHPETIYYLPFPADNVESKLNSALELEVKKPRYKFSRPGKFSLDEIEQILRVTYKDKIDPENIDKVIKKDNEKFKKVDGTIQSDFSLNKIKKVLGLTEQELVKEQGNLAQLNFKKALLENFTKIFTDKFTLKGIESYLQKRQERFNKIVGIPNSASFEEINYKNVLTDFWFIAFYRRNNSLEAETIIKNYPDCKIDFLKRCDKAALIDAVNRNDLPLARTLIKVGAKVNHIIDGISALMEATQNGNDEITKLLIDSEADVNLISAGGKSALIFATDKLHLKVIETLIEAGTKQVRDALFVVERMRGISYEEKDKFLSLKELFRTIVEIDEIIEFSAFKKITADDANKIISVLSKHHLTSNSFDLKKEQNEYIPIISHLLLNFENAEVLKLLSDNLDLFINQKNLGKPDCEGRLPLSIAINKATSTSGEIQEQLIKIAAKIADKMGLPILKSDESYLTAEKKENKNNDTDATNKFGADLLAAAKFGKLADIKALITKVGVNFVNESGQSALMAAAKMGNAQVVNFLLLAGADVNLTDNKGNPALIGPLNNGDSEVIKLLINAWASLDIINKEDKSVREIADEMGELETIEELIAAREKTATKPLSGKLENSNNQEEDSIYEVLDKINKILTTQKMLKTEKNTTKMELEEPHTTIHLSQETALKPESKDKSKT